MMVTWPVVALVLGALATGGGSDTAKPRRETIEWCNIWVPDATSTDHPRVLLIGDSICVGYYGRVAKALEGRAYVAQLATSAAVGDSALLDQVRIVMSQYHFDVVHFNIGHHGMDYTETEYRAELPKLLRLIRNKAPGVPLIWATTTPSRKSAPDTRDFAPNNDRLKARNRIAAELMAKQKIDTDDMYSLVEGHPEYAANDGVHFNAEGQAVEAAQVADYVGRALTSLGK